MRESSLNVRLTELVHAQRYITANSRHILGTYTNMTLFIGVTQETTKITDPKDRTILVYTIKTVRETAHDQSLPFRDINSVIEVLLDFKQIHALYLTVHAH